MKILFIIALFGYLTKLENLFWAFKFQIIRKGKVIIRAAGKGWIFRMQIMKTWNESR